MCAGFARTTLITPTVSIDLLSYNDELAYVHNYKGCFNLTCAVTDVSFVPLDEFAGQLIQHVKIIARIGDLPWLEAKPPHSFQDTLEVLGFLGFGVRVVITQVALATVVCRIAKVYEDSFGVSNVKVAIGFGREASEHFATCRSEVLLAKMWVELRVLARFVKSSKETLREDCS